MRNKKISRTVRIYDETYEILKTIAEQEGCWQVTVIDRAIKLYGKLKK